jgi:hypothetical protein
MNIDSTKNNKELKSIYLEYHYVDSDIDPMYIYLRDCSLDDAISRLRSITKERTDCDIQILKAEMKEKPKDCLYDANYVVGDMNFDELMETIKSYKKILNTSTIRLNSLKI